MSKTQAHHKGRSPEEIVLQQKEDAARQKKKKFVPISASHIEGGTIKMDVPAAVVAQPPAPLTIDDRTPAEVYADEVCQTSIVGQLIRFDGKIGKYTIVETGEDVTNREFIAIMTECLCGFIRFHGEGLAPSRVQGQPFKGWLRPKRDTLGDNDPNAWPVSPLSKKPEDPWKSQINIVLVDPKTHAFYTFATVSRTG